MSEPYISVFHGPVSEDGKPLTPRTAFHHFSRVIQQIHVKNGYWRFQSEGEGRDDARAYCKGLQNPEEVLLSESMGMGSHDDIELRWLPGKSDTYRVARRGTAKQHIQAIRMERAILGLPDLDEQEVPVYPADSGRKLAAHRTQKHGQQLSNSIKSATGTSNRDIAGQSNLSESNIVGPTPAVGGLSTDISGAQTPESPAKPVYSPLYQYSTNDRSGKTRFDQGLPPTPKKLTPGPNRASYAQDQVISGTAGASPENEPLLYEYGAYAEARRLAHVPYRSPYKQSVTPPFEAGFDIPRSARKVRGDKANGNALKQEHDLDSSKDPGLGDQRWRTTASGYSEQGKYEIAASQNSHNSSTSPQPASFRKPNDTGVGYTAVLCSKPPMTESRNSQDTHVSPAIGPSDDDLLGRYVPPYDLTSPVQDMPFGLEELPSGTNLPCVECNQTDGHAWDCYIGHFQFQPLRNLHAVQLRDIAEAVERNDPEQWREHQGPRSTPSPDPDRVTDLVSIAMDIGAGDDLDLKDLPDTLMLLMWSMKSAPGAEIIRHDYHDKRGREEEKDQVQDDEDMWDPDMNLDE
ncbi:hypothetical protein BCR34DRAFT_597885 [Clohesyomyces aquaticus]|uniref:Uncharacterized protein n=1 Tax=Clohesyomyces aquaticus TaxID=1231657 RepID=A0A1Y2A100_9PLEO|nr:hypothetical protein BCR34DRAFT_597885 [Clohesyomyces aquaticus]